MTQYSLQSAAPSSQNAAISRICKAIVVSALAVGLLPLTPAYGQDATQLKKLVALQQAQILTQKAKIEALDATTKKLAAAYELKGFRIGGKSDLFYPVFFRENDGCWNSGASDLRLARASTHIDTAWKGSMSISFQFHSSRCGNGSSFLEASTYRRTADFIGDYDLAPTSAGLVVWLKGDTTYHYQSRCVEAPSFNVDGPIVGFRKDTPQNSCGEETWNPISSVNTSTVK